MKTSSKCAAVRRLVAPYLDGTMDSTSRLRVKAHLRQCRVCREVFAQATTRGILEAQAAMRAGVRGKPWEFLRRLAGKGEQWARDELRRTRDGLQGALELLPGLSECSAAAGGATLGPAGALWPASIRLDVVNPAGRPLGRQAVLQVVQPATVLPAGRFLFEVRTEDESVNSHRLLCTVRATRGVEVTFEGDFVRDPNQKGLRARIEAGGLPRRQARVVYPFDQVKLYVQASQREPT
jgi:hypothetical protein